QQPHGTDTPQVSASYPYLTPYYLRPPNRKTRTSLHPPVLRPEILAAKTEPRRHLLVYQTYTTNQDLPEMLQRTGLECRIYGVRRDLRGEEHEGNLVYKPFSEQGFIDDLPTARAVVASGGFTPRGHARC